MATSTEDLKTQLKRVQDRVVALGWQDRVTSIAAPEPSLRTELGPLTGKLEREKTRQCAAAMALEFGARADFKFQLGTLRVAFASATLSSGNGGSEALSALRAAILTLSGAVDTAGRAELSKKPPPSPLVKVLDALLVQSLAAVPFAGPFLAGAAQGIGTLLAAGVTTGFQSIANYALTPAEKDKSTLADVLGGTTLTDGVASAMVSADGKVMAGAVGKAVSPGDAGGAVSFFYELWRKDREKTKNKDLDRIVSGGNLDHHVDLVRVMDAQTQNQVASNQIYDRLFSTVKPIEEEKKLEQLLNKRSDTIAQFFKKVPDALNAYRQYVLKLMYASVVNSLGPDLVALETEIRRIAATSRSAPPYFLSSMNESKIELAVTLVMGYYFYRFIKNNPAHRAPLVEVMQKYYPAWSSDGAGNGVSLSALYPTVNPESQEIIKTFREIQKFKSLTEAPPGIADARPNIAVRAVRHVTGFNPHEAVFSDAITSSGMAASKYFEILKASLSNTLAKNLNRGEANTPYIKDIVRLLAVCALIVNEVLAAAALKKSFSYQDSWIDVLVELEFVARYSKWFGRIDTDKKKKVTGWGSADPNNFRLRYPGSLPSDAERTMIYMFASIVVLKVDPGKMVTGDQDWAKVKSNLYQLIGLINEAEL